MRSQPRATRSSSVATAAAGVTTNPLVSRLATAGDSLPSSADGADAARRGGRVAIPAYQQQPERGEQQQHRPPQRPGVGTREEREQTDHPYEPDRPPRTARSWHGERQCWTFSTAPPAASGWCGLAPAAAGRRRRPASRPALIASRSARCRRNWAPGSVLTSSRSVTPSGRDLLDAEQLRCGEHVAGVVLGLAHLLGDVVDDLPGRREVGVVGDVHVEDGDRVQLRAVADAADLAVRHVPHRAVLAAQRPSCAA